jgi:hypothetical protein
MYIDDAFLSYYVPQVIEVTKAKNINHPCLPMYSLNKATNPMIDE